MSKRSRPIRRGNPPAPSAPKQSNSGVMFVALALVVLAGLGVWSWRTWRRPSPLPASPLAGAQATNAPPSSPAVAANSEFQKLKGKWLRPDGGYILELKSVDAAGKLDAAYLNPKPVHVAKAEASNDGTATKVFIELRDVNYPGSTYTLTYVSANDQLSGIYYQALQQQRFEVVFVRQP